MEPERPAEGLGASAPGHRGQLTLGGRRGWPGRFGDVQTGRQHFGHHGLIWGSVTVVLDHHTTNASRLRQRDGERLGIMSAVIFGRV